MPSIQEQKITLLFKLILFLALLTPSLSSSSSSITTTHDDEYEHEWDTYDYYKILGFNLPLHISQSKSSSYASDPSFLEWDSSSSAIKRAFRVQSLLYHPDKLSANKKKISSNNNTAIGRTTTAAISHRKRLFLKIKQLTYTVKHFLSTSIRRHKSPFSSAYNTSLLSTDKYLSELTIEECTARFERIKLAYDTLKSEERRAVYDRELRNGIKRRDYISSAGVEEKKKKKKKKKTSKNKRFPHPNKPPTFLPPHTPITQINENEYFPQNGLLVKPLLPSNDDEISRTLFVTLTGECELIVIDRRRRVSVSVNGNGNGNGNDEFVKDFLIWSSGDKFRPSPSFYKQDLQCVLFIEITERTSTSYNANLVVKDLVSGSGVWESGKRLVDGGGWGGQSQRDVYVRIDEDGVLGMYSHDSDDDDGNDSDDGDDNESEVESKPRNILKSLKETKKRMKSKPHFIGDRERGGGSSSARDTCIWVNKGSRYSIYRKSSFHVKKYARQIVGDVKDTAVVVGDFLDAVIDESEFVIGNVWEWVLGVFDISLDW